MPSSLPAQIRPSQPPDHDVFVAIKPRPKGRPRFSRYGHAYTDPKTREYEKALADAFQESMDRAGHVEPFAEDLVVDMTFFFLRPKTSKERRPKPDADNCAKSAQDAGNGTLYLDDSQIVEVTARKLFSEQEGVLCGIWRLA